MTFYITAQDGTVVDADNLTPQDEARWIEYLRQYGPIIQETKIIKRKYYACLTNGTGASLDVPEKD